MINVAILGYGTVGSGVYKIIKENNSHISRRAGDDISVKYVLDLRDFPGDPVEEVLVHDVNVIMEDEEVDIVVEVMGGVEPAYTFVRRALESGKSVCTSNKELVAAHGAELLEIARENNVNFFFEASVGGGIPIIRPLIECITVDHIEEIQGIMNGTTNYILTKMEDEGADFDTVLKVAQDKGYAERNPEADIEGYDACRKIAILTSLAYEKQVNYEDIYTEGITKITTDDFKYMKKLGTSIKLLGIARKVLGITYSMVAPFVVYPDNPLYGVKKVFNAILVKGDMLGDVMFYGKGAGSLPTASAVVSDVVDAVKRNGYTASIYWNKEKRILGGADAFTTPYFVRVKGVNIKDKIQAAFGDVEYIELDDKLAETETAFMTKVLSGSEFDQAASDFEVISRIRVSK
ncbi:MAG: homoserine dehydrogenase [Eubacterium sp.]|nr:homoserine dehydrogenase [Eubacterium sp.]